MTLSASALSILVSVALAITIAAPIVLIVLFILDWQRNRLW